MQTPPSARETVRDLLAQALGELAREGFLPAAPANVPMKATPFFFVVDQRRLGTGQGGGPTRGQIVRVKPFGLAANGYLPVYEDYTASGGLFPIQ